MIGPDGTLNNVQSATRDANTVLVNYALQNLRTWRFEPGESDTPLTITYSFLLVNSPSFDHGPDLRISLPDRITITDNPTH
jgi:Gram-negative bacterial TonB protein C-terminal